MDEPIFPGGLEFILRDANWVERTFVEKETVICREPLGSDAEFPVPAFMRCQIVRKWIDERGMDRCVIDTEFPLGIETRDGQTKFEVYVEQVCM
ncbi:hypothetical protein [Verrucomicrobium spinosum]|uniref:hypothetical protein n=1 Tax=Verrucomicrobium spinosum TaxID=2736 RepID=UPI000B12F227|nr:hypothetical protein [Verrucomicrobium spinosum]